MMLLSWKREDDDESTVRVVADGNAAQQSAGRGAVEVRVEATLSLIQNESAIAKLHLPTPRIK